MAPIQARHGAALDRKVRAPFQARRSVKVERPFAEAGAQRGEFFVNARASRALAEMALHLQIPHQIQLAIHVSMDQLLCLAAAHVLASLGFSLASS